MSVVPFLPITYLYSPDYTNPTSVVPPCVLPSHHSLCLCALLCVYLVCLGCNPFGAGTICCWGCTVPHKMQLHTELAFWHCHNNNWFTTMIFTSSCCIIVWQWYSINVERLMWSINESVWKLMLGRHGILGLWDYNATSLKVFFLKHYPLLVSLLRVHLPLLWHSVQFIQYNLFHCFSQFFLHQISMLSSLLCNPGASFTGGENNSWLILSHC